MADSTAAAAGPDNTNNHHQEALEQDSTATRQENHDDDQDDDAGIIRSIGEETRHRIISGQAVTDLASAVKELVDNALDAGSQSINIRLFNQGLDIVEVSDDGSGIPQKSRAQLAQAHATSKIRDFDDIYTAACATLGFRGEALFCLANLSEKLVVATRTQDEPVAQKLEYQHDGSLDPHSIVSVPRKVGTTVAVVKLLSALPVRRSDMERRIVQHRSKLIKLMEAYAIFNVGIRINLMDVVGRKENVLLATTASSATLEQTISSVLGSKYLASVTPVSIDLSSALDPSSPKGDWKMEGFISKAPEDTSNSGGGGAKAGQQYFSINGRPVELPKVARVLGDVWRTVGGGNNGKKKLSFVLTLTLPNQEYDVNLSPEKRQVMLTHEAAICQLIQTGVTELWVSQTQGQFTASASQPTGAAAAAAAAAAASSTSGSSNDTDDDAAKKPPPKVNNIQTLLNLQETNRKRAREKYASVPTVPTRDSNNNEDEMEIDNDHAGDEHSAARKAYMRKFREAQKEQRKLNASRGDVDCQYGEEHAPEQMPQQEDPSPHRVRRRGGFVHDITTAKQWERPASIGRNFQLPEGIEDPSDSEEEAEVKRAPEKRQRFEQQEQAQPEGESSPVATAEKPCLEEAGIGEQCSSRRVTLSLNNELAAASSSTESLTVTNLKSSKAASDGDGTTDGDKLLWVDAQARFNQREGPNLEKEIDVLTKTSVSPKQTHETPHITSKRTNTNSAPALNLDQFAFGCDGGASEKSPAGRANATQPAVSPEEERETPAINPTQEATPTSGRRTEQAEVASDVDSPFSTDESSSPVQARPSNVVWDAFQGTESVVKMTKIERSRIEERKRRLKQAAITGTSDESGAEALTNGTNSETKKIKLSKGDFADMTILGQFNLGFILALDKHCNLWILDQHACDERFNFEGLMESTVMHEQKLISPMPLELDISEENCVMDNLKIFAANGFKFKYDEDKPPRHRLSLTTLPHSGARDGRKAVSFGKEDISALCAILGVDGGSTFDDDGVGGGGGGGGGTGADGSGLYGNNAVRRYAGSLSQVVASETDKVLIRLPKAIAMFASRACRGSIMIGTALSKKEMSKVVQRLDELNDPWKCAHGRPTMTHVVNLQQDLLNDERKAAELATGATLSMSLTQTEQS